MRQISAKQAKKRRDWNKLTRDLIRDRANYCCECCGEPPDGRGLVGHHIKFLSQGGDGTAENCIILCGKCHSARHGIYET